MGVDCQFNTYHPPLVKNYLRVTAIPFQYYADSLLQLAQTATAEYFENYSSESFNTYLGELVALKDSLMAHKDVLVAASSEKEFQLLHGFWNLSGRYPR